MLDLLIKNGKIIDGTGSKAYKADIAIKMGRILDIGEKIEYKAKTTIDASGLIVSPGFIDVHSHNDLVPFMEKDIKDLKIGQGVTTELVGQCGLGVVPCVEPNDITWKNYISGVVGKIKFPFAFDTLDNYFKKIESVGLRNNVSALISHGAIRCKVMGFSDREATPYEVQLMSKFVEIAMKEGAFGMSLGLQYMPGIVSGKDELVELSKIVAKYDGVVMVHLRNHNNTILEALDEMIDVAKGSGVSLHISHMRSYNSRELGCIAEDLIEKVENAHKNGVKISFDEHLYLSGSTLMSQLLPPWATAGGSSDMRFRFEDERNRERLKLELEDKNTSYSGWDNYSYITGWDGVLITAVKLEKNKKYQGRTVGEVARELNISPIDFVIELLIEEDMGVAIVTLDVFSEEDTIKLIKHPLQMVGSDSIPAGTPHPRLYGNFPMYIGKFVREKKAISIEEAIYKATYYPAKTFGFENIGRIAPNYNADIVIFDYDKIKGYEDYFNPRKVPEGIEHVIINGKIAIIDGIMCENFDGRVYKK
jgi:N-acyl-D-amino-acid deacylase